MGRPNGYLAIVMEEMVRTGQVESYAEIAHVAGVSRTRLSQIMELLELAPDIQGAVLDGALAVGEHQLRLAARSIGFTRQRQHWFADQEGLDIRAGESMVASSFRGLPY